MTANNTSAIDIEIDNLKSPIINIDYNDGSQITGPLFANWQTNNDGDIELILSDYLSQVLQSDGVKIKIVSVPSR